MTATPTTDRPAGRAARWALVLTVALALLSADTVLAFLVVDAIAGPQAATPVAAALLAVQLLAAAVGLFRTRDYDPASENEDI